MELRATRTKFVLLLLLSSLFLFGFIALSIGDRSADQSTDFFRWVFVAFWFAGCLVFAVQSVRPPLLRTNSEGFTSVNLFRKPKLVPWGDVEEFFIWRTGRGNKFIGYRLRPEARRTTALAKLNSRLGADGILPSNWPIPADELVAKLNAMAAAAKAQ